MSDTNAKALRIINELRGVMQWCGFNQNARLAEAVEVIEELMARDENKSGGGTFALEDGMIVWKPNGAALIRAALVSAHDTMLAIRTTDLGRSDREMLDAARAQVRTALEEFKPWHCTRCNSSGDGKTQGRCPICTTEFSGKS